MIVIGGGLAGLTVARELARVGRQVTVLEERANLCGLIPRGTLAGVNIDLGADAYTTRATEVTDYIRSLGLETIDPNGTSWIWDGTAFPMPVRAQLGIPADPRSPEITERLTDPERVAADETLPPEVGAGSRTLGQLVRARMGDEIVERLVSPIVSAIYSTHPDNLALDPVLAANFTDRGTLCGAVEAGLSGPAIASIRGGMHRLPEELTRQAAGDGARIVTGARVAALRTESGGYRVFLDEEGAAKAREAGCDVGDDGTLAAADVVVATGVKAAQNLLPGAMELEEFELPRGRLTTHVTLAVDAPELDAAPRGSGMLCVPGTARAKAITHMSNKWPWMREESDLHFLRVSYPVNEEVPTGQALADANQLLGTAIEESQVADSYLLRWGGALVPATPALREWASRIEPPRGLWITGVWKAGSGISAVVPHALRTATEIVGRA